jgi:quercetin dioxygenase-like cupin family protein
MRNLAISTPAILASLLCLGSVPLAAQEPKVTPVMMKELADVPGKEVVMVTVEYAPGGADEVHRHNADAIVYVLEGSVIEQVKGGKPDTLTAGETFFEGPEDVHIVGRNASDTQPAKILAILVKKKGAPPLVPAKQE